MNKKTCFKCKKVYNNKSWCWCSHDCPCGRIKISTNFNMCSLCESEQDLLILCSDCDRRKISGTYCVCHRENTISATTKECKRCKKTFYGLQRYCDTCWKETLHINAYRFCYSCKEEFYGKNEYCESCKMPSFSTMINTADKCACGASKPKEVEHCIFCADNLFIEGENTMNLYHVKIYDSNRKEIVLDEHFEATSVDGAILQASLAVGQLDDYEYYADDLMSVLNIYCNELCGIRKVEE